MYHGRRGCRLDCRRSAVAPLLPKGVRSCVWRTVAQRFGNVWRVLDLLADAHMPTSYNLQFWILDENAFCAVIEEEGRTVRRAGHAILPRLRVRVAQAYPQGCPDLPSPLPGLTLTPAWTYPHPCLNFGSGWAGEAAVSAFVDSKTGDSPHCEELKMQYNREYGKLSP